MIVSSYPSCSVNRSEKWWVRSWEFERGSQEQGTRTGFCLHGVKVNLIWFRSGDTIQSYLRLKTAYFICFWQVYILLSCKVNERKSGYENYKRKKPQKSLSVYVCVCFSFVVIWPKEKSLRIWIFIKANA